MGHYVTPQGIIAVGIETSFVVERGKSHPRRDPAFEAAVLDEVDGRSRGTAGGRCCCRGRRRETWVAGAGGAIFTWDVSAAGNGFGGESGGLDVDGGGVGGAEGGMRGVDCWAVGRE